MPGLIFTADGSETCPKCPLCGESRGRGRYSYSDMKIISCVNCGLWRTCPRLSAEQLTRYYEETHYSPAIGASGQYHEWGRKHENVFRRNAELVLELERAKAPGKQPGSLRVLDVGSGQGWFLDQCRKLGLDARGIEVSPHAVSFAVKDLGLNVSQSSIEALPKNEIFDVITLWEVIEHVDNPVSTLEHIRAHLREGGTLWVAAPNVHALQRFRDGERYFNLRNKSHLTHFDKRTLKATIERAGFTNATRVVHWGGGSRSGPGAALQYAARYLALGTDLRYVATAP